MNEIIIKVNRIIANQLEIDVDKLSPEASLFEDLGADSIDTVELVIAIEVEFDIEIPEKDTENFLKLKDIYNYLESKVNKK